MDAVAIPAGVTPAQFGRLRAAAGAFEAQALGQLLQPMFDTLHPEAGGFGGGQAEAQWQPMLVDAYAKATANAGGIGIAAPVLREMLRLQAAHPSPTTARTP